RSSFPKKALLLGRVRTGGGGCSRLATQVRLAIDLTADQRNSFAMADQTALAKLAEPLVVTVHLAPEDPRYADLQRNVLAKLERAMPNVSIRLADGRQNPRT